MAPYFSLHSFWEKMLIVMMMMMMMMMMIETAKNKEKCEVTRNIIQECEYLVNVIAIFCLDYFDHRNGSCARNKIGCQVAVFLYNNMLEMYN